MSKPTPPTYRTTNWRSYNAALKQRGSLLIWPETVWLPEPSGKRGRSVTFTDAAIQACLTLKALFGLPLRQTTGLVASLLGLARLDWAVPDFRTLSPRQKGLNVAIPYRPSTGTLHLLIDTRVARGRSKASGLPRNTGLQNHVNGARSTWESMPISGRTPALRSRPIRRLPIMMADNAPISAT